MRRLDISLLGTFTVELDGVPATEFGYDKVRALLTYLAVEARRPQRRDTLAGLLWPEQPQSEALNNLRTALSHLRGALHDRDTDPPFLRINRDSLQLNPDAAIEIDTARFAYLTSRSQLHAHKRGNECQECVRAMAEAVALYHGEFLPGFALDSASFEEWLTLQRESFHERVLNLLDRLVAHEEAQGTYGRVIALARRQIQLEPWHEPAHRCTMRALALSGQRAAAVAQYETCQKLLSRELGIEPEPATVELYERILSGDLLRPPKAANFPRERDWHHAGSCPYRGLAAFREADAPCFFGRDAFTQRLLQALSSTQGVSVLVGSSGAGKSSVVFAGLVPRLRSLGGWEIVNVRPGSEPFEGLASALVPLLVADAPETGRVKQTRELARRLEAGETSLADQVVRYLGQRRDASRLLLIVDQFEELYTLCLSPDTRVRFIDVLLDAVAPARPGGSSPGPLALLLTLRADFVGQALGHRGLAHALQTAAQILGPMAREELHEAIEKPAAAQGAVFEAGLVGRLLGDVAAAPGSLPLLEFALTLLWHRLDRGWLTHDVYEAIGRVQGALTRYADEAYDALTTDEQALARRVFTQLVQPGEGTEDTRRLAMRADVGDAAWDLVQHLADQRLVVTGRDPMSGAETVEVVHETLIRNWERLQAWMAEDRAFRMWQERLRVSLRTWESTGHDEGALLRGVPLAEAEEWTQIRQGNLSEGEHAYVAASVALREAEHQAGLEAARQLREAHKVALHQAAIGLSSEARLQMEGPDQDLAVLLALEAVEHYPYTWQAELALAEGVLGLRLAWQSAHGAPIFTPPEISPDGTRFLVPSNDGVLRMYDMVSGRNLLTIQAYTGVAANYHAACWCPSGYRILTCAQWGGWPRVWDADSGSLLVECPGDRGGLAQWSPDGARILRYSEEQPVTIWDARTGKRMYVLPGTEGAYATYAPDGRWVATTLGQIWDAETGKLAATLAACRERVAQGERLTFQWSPDGKRLGTGIAGSACVWDAATFEEALILTTGYVDTADLWWSPDGRRLLTTGATGGSSQAAIWDASNGEKLRDLPFTEAVGRSPWSPQGDRIAVPDAQGYVTVWDADSGIEVRRFPAHRGKPCVTWLPDGSGFITTAEDGLARILRIAAPGFTLSCEPDCPSDTWDGFNDAVWSPDGTHVARPFDDGTARIWEVTSRHEVARISRGLDRPGIATNFVAWSPDSRRILTGGGDGGVEIWSAATGEFLIGLTGHGDAALDPVFTLDHVVMGLAWSPDGGRALSCGRDRRAVVWDTSTGEALTVFTGQDFFWGAWSPDGERLVLCDQLSYAGPVRIWDAETGEAALTLLPEDFGYGTSAVAWSPDGTRIVTFSLDDVGRLWDAATGVALGTFSAARFCFVPQWSPTGDRFLVGGTRGVRVWDAATLQLVAQYPYPSGPGNSAGSWSSDGTAVAIGYANGDTKVYPAWQSLEELIAYARAHCVLRELTPEERARYGLASPEP